MKKRSNVSRRDLIRGGSSVGLTMLSTANTALPATAVEARTTATSTARYEAIGVRPLINARGTFTIITGSETLTEVKAAMDDASRNFVHMDELMDGAGKRIAEVTQAPWAIVTAGCCAALTNFTAACIAGTNPERMQRLPNLTGMKNEAIIPKYSRNVYDHAIRMLGVKIIEVDSPEELENAFSERTALIYILAGPGDQGPLGTKAVSDIAKRHKVPVLVDAAAEILTIPNVHLQRGATAVAYSGGKCIRGPQAGGLLLGDKELLQAAWANSAPHHAFGRSLKAGKEEIMGMVAAVEQWPKRDHEAEWDSWNKTLAHISDVVTKIPGVATHVTVEESLSNHTPSLHIEWDGDKLGITGTELAQLLYNTTPRIALAHSSGKRPTQMKSAVTVTPWMMMPGEDKVVADRIHSALMDHPKYENPPIPSGQLASVEGQWQATLTFGMGSAQHVLIFEQQGDKLLGTHRGEYISGDLSGAVVADTVQFTSIQRIEGQTLVYEFSGKLSGNTLAGDLDMGEYGKAKWTAERHQYHLRSRA